MAIRLKVNGNDSGSDRLFAAVAGRRFPAHVEVANTGSDAVDVDLRIQAAPGAKVSIADTHLPIGPGSAAETRIQAETPSKAAGDTVLEALVGGVVQAEFRFTVVSLARESVFHNLVPQPPA